MADHLRKQIRDAAIAALTGLATTGARVDGPRTQPFTDAELPALVVDLQIPDPDNTTFGGGASHRLVLQTADLVVTAYVKEDDTFESVMDTIFGEVQVALAQNQNLAGTKYVNPPRLDVERDGGGEADVAFGRITSEVFYNYWSDAPDVAV